MKHKIWLAYLAAIVLVTGCVPQDQYRLLENRVAALESESSRQASEGSGDPIVQLQENLDASAGDSREKYAEVKNEIKMINERFQKFEGTIEEMRHNLGSSDQSRQEALENELERLSNAIALNSGKIMALEKYMGFEPSKSLLPKTEGSSPAQATAQAHPQPDSEQGLYDLAKRMFDQGDKEGARVQFENFINKYPKSQNADNARFWIAESYYAEKWFEKAILEYQKVLETYPDSNKTAAARLKQGYAFAELGEKANARLILKELIKRHPASNEAKYAAEKLKSLK